MDILTRFQEKYLTLQVTKIIEPFQCKDRSLQAAIVRYQNYYRLSFEKIVMFSQPSLYAIRNSYITEEYRPTTVELQSNSIYLLFEKTKNHAIRQAIKRIAEISTCYQPQNVESKYEYRQKFALLVRHISQDLFDRFDIDPKKTLFIAPLRAGRFISKVVLENWSALTVHEVHTKRIYYKNSLAALGVGSCCNMEKIAGYEYLVIGDGGIVSGITIVGLLYLLKNAGLLPQSVFICSVHASLYGIMNILQVSRSLGVDIKLVAGITSYSISDTLYAFYDKYPWKRGTLVTGDIGDYLS